mmetsp:Transcript_4608/g.8543  ORF Transcript_4608/g.8543 Transcript_4608/m.8543 type:complete len:395 (-) Transcript_4608:107-1291(-)
MFMVTTIVSFFSEAFSDSQSPQYRAAIWAADVAPVESTERMISRYALATFYFALNGDDWDKCGRGSTDCDLSEEWLTAENECDWYAVECRDPVNGDYTVEEIFFRPHGIQSTNMRGTLPFDVSLLSSLTVFIISREPISGPFPDWSTLTTLEQVLLNNNELEGSFPAYILEQNPSLRMLHLSGNFFEGPLPVFPVSDTLQDLRIDNNNFTGSIVSDISNLRTIKSLYLDNNELSGEVPEALYDLTDLTTLRLGNNTGLAGIVSTNIGKLSNLIRFNAANTSMGGALPEELFLLTELKTLNLGVGSFAGPLPESFSNLINLEAAILHTNSFTGTIPSGFANLAMLETLELHGNDLTGTVPTELCGRRGEAFNDLKTLTVDDSVACDCCTPVETQE